MCRLYEFLNESDTFDIEIVHLLLDENGTLKFDDLRKKYLDSRFLVKN